MEHPVIQVSLDVGINILITPLDALEWNGELCEDCGCNIYTIIFGVELFLPTDISPKWSLAKYELCISCINVPSEVAQDTARVVLEKYGNFSGSDKRTR